MKDEILDTLEHITECFWDEEAAYDKSLHPIVKFDRPQRLPIEKPNVIAYKAECMKVLAFAGIKKNSEDWKKYMRYINRKLEIGDGYATNH